MNKVVQILMERDGMSQEEATELVQQTKEELLDCMGTSILEGDEIIANNLGLEPDYLFDIFDI